MQVDLQLGLSTITALANVCQLMHNGDTRPSARASHDSSRRHVRLSRRGTSVFALYAERSGAARALHAPRAVCMFSVALHVAGRNDARHTTRPLREYNILILCACMHAHCRAAVRLHEAGNPPHPLPARLADMSAHGATPMRGEQRDHTASAPSRGGAPVSHARICEWALGDQSEIRASQHLLDGGCGARAASRAGAQTRAP